MVASTMNGIYISKVLVSSLLNFLKEKDLIKKDLELVVFQDEEEYFGLDYQKIKGAFELDSLRLPYYLDINEDTILRKILKETHNVDIFNLFSNNIDSALSDLTFSILHEFGHLNHFLNSTTDEWIACTDEYIKGKRALGRLEDTLEDEELDYYYRNLNLEVVADTFVFDVINNYKEELEELLLSYEDMEVEEVVLPFGEFYEI